MATETKAKEDTTKGVEVDDNPFDVIAQSTPARTGVRTVEVTFTVRQILNDGADAVVEAAGIVNEVDGALDESGLTHFLANVAEKQGRTKLSGKRFRRPKGL